MSYSMLAYGSLMLSHICHCEALSLWRESRGNPIHV